MCLISWERTQQGTHINFFGGTWGQKGGPKRVILGHKKFSLLFFPALNQAPTISTDIQFKFEIWLKQPNRCSPWPKRFYPLPPWQAHQAMSRNCSHQPARMNFYWVAIFRVPISSLTVTAECWWKWDTYVWPHLFSRARKKGFSIFSCVATPSRTVTKTQPLEVALSLQERVDLRCQKEGILGKKIAWERVGWTGQKKEKRMRKKRWVKCVCATVQISADVSGRDRRSRHTSAASLPFWKVVQVPLWNIRIARGVLTDPAPCGDTVSESMNGCAHCCYVHTSAGTPQRLKMRKLQSITSNDQTTTGNGKALMHKQARWSAVYQTMNDRQKRIIRYSHLNAGCPLSGIYPTRRLHHYTRHAEEMCVSVSVIKV